METLILQKVISTAHTVAILSTVFVAIVGIGGMVNKRNGGK